MLPKTSAYVKRYDGQTKQMYFLNKDDDFLEKYNTVWCKVSGDIKKEFDRKSVSNKELLKTIIKSHGDKVTYLSSSNGFWEMTNVFWESKFENVFLERVTLKSFFLREQFYKSISENVFVWGSNFKNIFLKRATLKPHFLREQFRKHIFQETNFENVFFKRAILKMYFLKGQLRKCTFWGNDLENRFFKRVILKMNFLRELFQSCIF